MKSGEYGSTSWILPLLIRLCNIWQAPCVVLGVRTPHTCCTGAGRGAEASQSDCMGQTSPMRQEGEAFHGRRARAMTVASV
jgi:hypothetical protein